MAARKQYDSIAIDQMESDETDDEDVFFNDPRRNLLKEFSKKNCNETHLNVGEEHMKVYLRVRPLSEDELNRQENQGCVEVEDDNHVVTRAPKDSHTYKNCTHGLGKTTHKFTFSKIFNEATSQKDLFNQTMLGLVKDFISGQNCLVFTYGVTSSGKTYTIQGQPSDAGVLPRALDVLFNSIYGKQVEGMKLKPKMFTDVVKLSSVEEEAEKKFKENTLKMSNDDEPDVMSLLGDDASDVTVNTTSCSESSNLSYATSNRQKASLDPEDLLNEIEHRVREETAVSVEDQGSVKFSIWISFAEIYNEQIFDLLVPIPKRKNVRRPVLKLSDDKNGSPYIKGLREIHVASADEAYKLLTTGKQNLSTACTKLNHQSSRSHCIFNIKILRVMDVEDPHVARVSMLTLCDLAGSERTSKTLGKGERLKEAGNINTSLMTLGRCIEMLRYNQHHKEKSKIIPFRDSKLTRLFQNFFSGRGKAAMIVNVNQCASMFDETLHVFKFSAIAKQVVVAQKPDPPPRPRYITLPVPPPVESVRAPSIAWATPGQLYNAEKVPLPEDEDDNLEETDEVAELTHIIEEMEKEIRGLRIELRHQEGHIREEVCQEMKKQFVAIHESCRERIRWTEEQAEETMEKRIKILTDAIYSDQRKSTKKAKKNQHMEDDEDEWVSSILLHQEKVKVEEKEEENSRLQQQIKTLLQKDTKEATKDDQTSVVEEMSHQLTELRQTITEKDEEIEKLNEMLEEAGETFAEKETELSRLHKLISTHEEKIKEQGKSISDLEEALRESQLALDTADRRLTKQEEGAATQNEAKAKLQEELTTAKGCVGFLEQTVKQKEEEVRVWKSRCQRAEEDSIKQEQALINGYKAEISTLKQQMLELKSNTSMTKAHSDSSPRKKATDEDKDAFYQNLSVQLKELQSELDKNSAVMLELQQALETARAVSEDLEQRLGQEKEAHAETRAQLSQLSQENDELQQLKVKVTQLENSFEDREQNLASKVEQNLKAEGLIAELEEELKTLKSADYPDQVVRLEKEVKKFRESLVGKDEQLDALTEKVEELQTVNTGLRDMVNQTTADLQAKEHILAELTAKVKVNEDLKQSALSPSSPLSSLQRRMREIRHESEATKNELTTTVKAHQKLEEELNTLKKTNKQEQEKIQQLNSHIKDLEFQLDEIQIDRSHIIEDQKMAEEKADQLQVKIEELEKCVEDLNSQLSKITSEKEQLASKDKSDEQMGTQNTKELKEELEQVRQELVAKSQLIEDSSEELQKVKDELKQAAKKGSKGSKKVIERLEGQCEELGQKVKDKESEIERLGSELSAIQSSADTGVVVKSHQIDSLQGELKSMRTEMSVMEKKIADRDHAIKDLNDLFEQNQKELDEKDFTLRTLRKEKDKGFSESGRVASEKMKELEEELEFKAQKISELEMVEEKVQQFEDETVSLKQKLGELENVKDEKENLENELNGKSQKLSDLQKVEEKNELLENELTSLRGKVSDLDNVTKEKEQLQHELEDKSQRLSELKTVEEKTVQLENELTSLRQNLCELETVKDENETAVSELKSLREQLCELQTVKKKNEQIEKELEDHIQALSDLEGIKEKLVQLQEEVVGKEKTVSELKTAREKDEGELKVQRDEIEKLLERLESTESEIKNLMSEKCELEKKAETLEENLHGKDHQLEELKKVLTDLQDKTKMSSDEANTELSKVKMELAETKSALHMTQTLHQRAKKELMDKTKHLQDMEERSKVKGNEEVNKRSQLEEEMASVKGKLVDLETLKQDLESKNQSLDNDLVSVLARVTDLTTQIADRDTQVKDLEAKIQEQGEQSKVQVQQEEEKLSALVKACEEKSSIIDSQAAKIKDLAGDQNKSDELGLEVGEKAKKIEELTNTINLLETKLQNSEAVLKTYSPKKDRQDMTRQLEDLQNALDREKVKSEEYHKLLDEMRVKACLSPGSESNSVRRLRKDKIDTDNALLEAKCKIASLERRLADSTLQVSPRKYNNEESQKLKLELQECHQKIETLEGQVRLQDRIFSSPRKRESLQRSSVVTSPTVHRELNRSQEREQTLRRQLQQASTNLQELGQKVSDLEDQLSHKVKAIQDAEDTIQALKNPGSRSGRPSTVAEVCRLEAELKQRWGQIQELQSDLIRRDEKLAAKSQALKDFKISMERERDDFEAALRDAKANESLIEMLKNAITEQEETMEKQDSYLQRKEEEIRNLSQELEKYTEKYRQVLETSGDSGRKMMELTRENARQVTEHSQQLKEQDGKVCKLNQTLQEQETTIRKLTEDKEKLGVVLKENNRELKDLEKLLSESRTETESLREKLSSNNENKSEAMQKADEEAALLQVKIREKEHAVRESQRALRRMEEDLNKAQQQVKQTETELVKVKQTLEEKEDKLKTWRTERDNLVAGLEGIMKKQQKEIYDLKEQVKAGQRGRHLDDSMVSPSKSCHHQEESKLPPARPPAPVRSSFRSQEQDNQDSSHVKSSHQGHCQGESSSGRSNHSKRHHDDQTLSPVRSSHSKRHHGDQILSPTRSSHRAHRQGSVALSPVNVKEEMLSTDSSGSDDRLKSPPPERETTHRSHRHSARKASINQCPLTKTPNPETTRGHRSSSRSSRKRRSVSESEIELPAKKRDNFDATFASEESSISDHVQIDATPPVAAKKLRKSRKKQGNTESEGKENTGPSSSSSRRTRRGTKGTEEPGLGRIGSIVSAIKNSSLTRSAKKLLDDISESPTKPTQEPSVEPQTPSTPDSHYIEVEDQSTQMSGGRKEEEQQHTKRSRKRHKLYNENLHISEPLEGGIFVPNTPTNDVHGIVLRKLRTRKH